jgi:hypothetical protein
MQSTPAMSIALLSAAHPSDSVMAFADTALPALIRAACPDVTILQARQVEARLAERGIVIPRRLDERFAREARAALGTELLLVPTVLGLVVDERLTGVGFNRDWQQGSGTYEGEGGIELVGWDLRTAARTVHLVRVHSSLNSGNADPKRLFVNATREAANTLSGACRTAAPVTAESSR